MRNNNNHIPEYDQKLAREVGEILEEDRSVLSLDDPLIDQIIDHKKNLYSSYEDELSESRYQSWNKISESLQKSSEKKHQEINREPVFKIFSSKNTSFLKAAAAIFFALLLSVIFLKLEIEQPEMVAQAGADSVTYTLSDQSRVQLRPHSSLFVIHESEDEIRYKLVGEAFFNVTKNDQRKFIVDAGSGLIEVIGTIFNVREWSKETVVYLQEGALSLSTADQSRQVILQPGETASVSSDFTISEPVQTNGRQYTSWQQNELILSNRSVNSVIQELEYHYSLELQVPHDMKDEILGGTLTLETKELSLKNLGIVLGGKFSSIEDNTYQFVE